VEEDNEIEIATGAERQRRYTQRLKDRVAMAHNCGGSRRKREAMTKIDDPKLRAAISGVLDYLEYEERKDFESDPRPGHIYQHLRTLREALESSQ
jgi:hypothetical protein